MVDHSYAAGADRHLTHGVKINNAALTLVGGADEIHGLEHTGRAAAATHDGAAVCP